jgi:hypothetical protein
MKERDITELCALIRAPGRLVSDQQTCGRVVGRDRRTQRKM